MDKTILFFILSSNPVEDSFTAWRRTLLSSSSNCLSVFLELTLDLFMKSLLRCDTSHLRSVRFAGTSREEHLFSWPVGDSQKFWPHRSPSAVKLLSPDCIYACVITTTRWQVADRWQIDGPCPWARTVGAWPLHPNYFNTEGGFSMVSIPRTPGPYLENNNTITYKYIFHTKVNVWILRLSLPRDLCCHKYTGTSFLI